MPDIAKLNVVVGADTSEAEAGFKRVNAGIGGFASAAGLALAGAAVGIGLLGGKAVGAAAEFEHTMSGVKAVSGATATEMKGLSDLALQLGKDTVFSAADAAAGIEELVKGGLSVGDIMGGAAKATLNLATAGGIALPDAAIIAANALAQFGLKGQDMAHVADLIAGAANASALDVGQFKFSLQMAGAVASTVGFKFDDLAVAIAEMGKAGIVGSDAGTSLKTMFLNLTPSTKAATSEMRRLGIITANGANQFFDATGKVKSMAEVAQVLQNATKGLTQQQKLASLEVMFGTDAIRGAAVFAREGAAGFDAMAASMGKVTAESVAAERLNNLSGDIEQLKGSVETAAITFGTVLLPALRGGAQFATGFVNSLIPWIERVGPQVVDWVGKVGAAFSGGGLLGVLKVVGADALAFGGTLLFWVTDLGPKLVDAIGAWGAALVGWIGPRIPAIFAAYLAFEAAIWGWLGATALKIGAKLFEWGAAFVGWIMPRIPAILAALDTLGAAVFTWIRATALPAIEARLGEWGAAFIAWIGPLIPPLLKELGGLASALWAWITDTAAPAILAKLGAWGQQFVAWIGPATDAFLAAWPANLTRFLDWIEFSAAPAIAATLSSWARAFVAWIGGEGSGTGAANGVLVALGNISSVVFEFISKTAEVLGPRLLRWAGAFLGWIVTDVIPFLAVELVKMQVAIGTWLVTDAIPWAARAFVALGAAIVGGIVAGILGLPNAIADAIAGIVSARPITVPVQVVPDYGPGNRWAPPVGGGVQAFVGGVPIRDSGGRGYPGHTYGIGVPELFTPDRPGTFTPLDQLGGPSAVNVTLTLDRQVLARVNARLDERYSKRGGR